MNPEDIRQKLRETGIPVEGGWAPTQDRQVKSPLVERQKASLRKLEGLISQQIEADQQRVADLHAALQRIKRGGGG